MAINDSSFYDRTVPIGARPPSSRRVRRNGDRRRVKPGWFVLLGLAILPTTPLCDAAPSDVAMAHKATVASSAGESTDVANTESSAHSPAESSALLENDAPATTPEGAQTAPATKVAGPTALGETQTEVIRTSVATPRKNAPKRVLIIALDGVRPDALLKADTPNIDGVAGDGAYHFDGRAGEITLSGPGWASLLTGVNRHKHGIVNNRVSDLSKYGQWPTLFTRYQQKHPKHHTASLVGWRPINTRLLAKSEVDVSQHGKDRVLLRRAKELLGQDSKLGMLFVHLDDPDTAGHEYGHHPSSKNYLKAIEAADQRVGEILGVLKQRSDRDEWLVMITTDHGGSKDGSHGRALLDHRRIFVVMSGRGVIPGRIASTPTPTDMAASIVDHLDLPPLSRGRALDGSAFSLAR